MIFSILITINSLGRFLIASAETMELAQLGLIFMNIGSCFCPPMLIITLSSFCRIKPPKWMTGLVHLLSCLVFALSVTIRHSTLFFRSMTLVRYKGYSILEREFGPAHFLYSVMLFGYLAVCIYILVKALRQKDRIYLRTVVTIALFALVIMTAYVLDRIFITHLFYSTHGYFLAMLVLLWRMERANMYDLPTNISASIEAMNENGYISFDRSYRVTGYNQKFRELFPDADALCQEDRMIPACSSPLYQEVVLWLYNRKKDERKTIQLGDRYYELIVRDIPYMHSRCVGYMVALADRTSENKYLNAMASYQADLERQVDKKTERISHIKDMMVVGMASMVESRDDSTGDHIKRTYAIMQVFADHLRPHAKELGVTDAFLDMVTRAAPMHDLGKIAIDDAVLKKQGRFTAQDFELMKVHPEEGAKIVRNILTGVEDDDFVKVAENVAHYHHEKWDGTGSPEGLKGDEIPIEARMMALPDVFDALASKRRYKDALPFDMVFKMIEGTVGTHFDPVLGKYFLECRPELEALSISWETSGLDSEHLLLSKKIKKGPEPV